MKPKKNWTRNDIKQDPYFSREQKNTSTLRSKRLTRFKKIWHQAEKNRSVQNKDYGAEASISWETKKEADRYFLKNTSLERTEILTKKIKSRSESNCVNISRRWAETNINITKMNENTSVHVSLNFLFLK